MLGPLTERVFSPLLADDDDTDPQGGRNALLNQYFGLLNAVAGNSPALLFSETNRPQFPLFLGALRCGVAEVSLATVNKVCVASYHKLAAALFAPQGDAPQEVGMRGGSHTGETDLPPTCLCGTPPHPLRILPHAPVPPPRSTVHHHRQ